MDLLAMSEKLERLEATVERQRELLINVRDLLAGLHGDGVIDAIATALANEICEMIGDRPSGDLTLHEIAARSECQRKALEDIRDIARGDCEECDGMGADQAFEDIARIARTALSEDGVT